MNQNEVNQDHSLMHEDDVSGLEEIQQAMDKINELSSNSNPDIKNPIDDNIDQSQEVADEKEIADEVEVAEQELVVEDENTTALDAPEQEDSKAVDDQKQSKKSKPKKLWKTQREKYKAIAERDAALEELARVKSERDAALQAGNYHYGQNAHADLEQAKLSKKKAIEEGDIDALNEADVATLLV